MKNGVGQMHYDHTFADNTSTNNMAVPSLFLCAST